MFSIVKPGRSSGPSTDKQVNFGYILDIKDYISSGVLESYIIGTISDEDRQKIERNLGRYPELRRELNRIEHLRQSRAFETNQKVASLDPALRVSSGISSHAAPVARVRNLNPENSVLFWRITAAAAVCLALLACYFVVELRSRLVATQIALRAELDRNQELASDLTHSRSRLDRTTGALEFLDDLTYTQVILAETSTESASRVTVFWDPRSTQVFLSIQNLPPLPRDKQYQLWAITDDNAFDAGTFDPGSEITKMKDISQASAFAVTIEPAGGSSRMDISNQILIGTTGL